MITNRLGSPVPPKGEYFAEIVIPQENQIAPAFIFEFERGPLKKLHQHWSRPILVHKEAVVSEVVEGSDGEVNYTLVDD